MKGKILVRTSFVWKYLCREAFFFFLRKKKEGLKRGVLCGQGFIFMETLSDFFFKEVLKEWWPPCKCGHFSGVPPHCATVTQLAVLFINRTVLFFSLWLWHVWLAEPGYLWEHNWRTVGYCGRSVYLQALCDGWSLRHLCGQLLEP